MLCLEAEEAGGVLASGRVHLCGTVFLSNLLTVVGCCTFDTALWEFVPFSSSRSCSTVLGWHPDTSSTTTTIYLIDERH